MHYSFSFLHMDVSPYLEKYARKKVQEKMNKYLTRPLEAKVTFYNDKKDFGCHLYVGGDSLDFFVSSSSSDMYVAVNMVVAKLENQLRKRKEILKVGRQRGYKAKRQVEALRA